MDGFEPTADWIARLPDDVVVTSDRKSMALVWPEGLTDTLSAYALRAACRCAWCTRDRALDCFVSPDRDIAISGVNAMGSHGLHVTFSDGHARGLYPWRYLDDLVRIPPSKVDISPLTGAHGYALKAADLPAQDRCL